MPLEHSTVNRVARVSLLLLALAALSALAEVAHVRVAGRAADSAAPATADDLAAKRAKVADEIAQLTKTKQAAGPPANQPGRSIRPTSRSICSRRSTWSMSSFRPRPNITTSWATSHDRLQSQLDNLHKFGPPEPKPYTFLLLEDIRDGLATQQEREAAFDADLAAAEQLLDQARVNLDRCQSDERAATERSGRQSPARQAERPGREPSIWPI